MNSKPDQKSRHVDLSVTPDDANWIFISGSDKEHRHLLDILFGVEALRSRGVKDERIFVYQDYPDFEPHAKPFDFHTRIFGLKDIEESYKTVKPAKVCFFIFTGHGSFEGIHTNGSRLSPTLFINLLRQTPGLERGFLILGQCFSGIFDSINAREKPEIGVMGATKLHYSFSNSMPFAWEKVSLVDKSGNAIPPWATNVFLFHFFNWIRKPIDIDGDERITLLDAFKYAGAKTNANMTDIKFTTSLDIHGHLEVARTKIREHVQKKNILSDVDLDTAVRAAEQNSKVLYLHQEPWLLHADLIRSTQMF